MEESHQLTHVEENHSPKSKMRNINLGTCLQSKLINVVSLDNNMFSLVAELSRVKIG